MPDPNRPLIALAAAMDLPEGRDVPEWLHLLPAVGRDIATFDGRGPYRVENPDEVIAASFSDPRDRNGLLVDENHALELAAPKGQPSPARGRITELQAREDGIWGRVDWAESGRRLVADRAYRGVSPVFVHRPDGRVVRIKNVALVNNPNLRGLTALNMETGMSFLARLAETLGKPATATEDELIAAVQAAQTAVAAQSSLAEIGTALGVEGSDPKAILVAAKLARGGTGDVAALQAENASLKSRLDAIEAGAKRTKAEAFIDQAIADKRAGVSAENREELVAAHMENPALVEKLIGAAVKLGVTHTAKAPPAGGEITALNAEQKAVAAALGVSEDAYLKTLKEEAR